MLHVVLPCICLASVLASEADERARLAAEAFASHPATQHIEVSPAVVIEVQLGGEFTLPGTVVDTWQFLAAKPPDLDSQRCLSAQITPTGHSDSDHSPLRRGLLVARVAATATTVNHHEVTVAHRLELHTRRLVPGVPTADVAGLSGPLRTAATVVTPFMDWDMPPFQEWLEREHLRAEAGESDVAFAHRCYRLIRTRLRYAFVPEMDRVASHVVTAGVSDCGGFSLVLASALRANGIPARVLAGRWAISAMPDDTLEGLPYGQWHVKMEFFATGVGWVPCDVSRDQNQPERWFGRDDGDFVTLHIDPDLQLDTLFGPRTQPWLQGIVFWVRGKGSLDGLTTHETWTVTHP